MDKTTLQVLRDAADKKIVCVGDVMLDVFVRGRVDRVSPEAPVPVLSEAESTYMPGGAANVAANAAAMGAVVDVIGVIGPDESGTKLRSLLDAQSGIHVDLVVDPDRATTCKTRFAASGQQMLRLDDERCDGLSRNLEDAVLFKVDAALKGASVLVLSDYAKGVLTDRLLSELRDLACGAAIPIIVDPKGRDFARYGEVATLKCNAAELALASGRPSETDYQVAEALRSIVEDCAAQAIIVTRAARGLSLIDRDGDITHISGRARSVYDVSGAGDTSLAAVAIGRVGGGDVAHCADLALTASGLAVERAGTAVVTKHDIIDALERGVAMATPSSIRLEGLLSNISEWRGRGLAIGFTNGCFDILHAGHVELLEAAKSNCDRLIVGLNSDDSVRRLKGKTRPIHSENDRARVLSALAFVDAVVVFEDDTPFALIDAIRPDLLVKGGDYTETQIVGAELVKQSGGRVVIHPLLEGRSSSNALRKLEGEV